MYKRTAIFLICRRLCEHGVDPEKIANLFTWRSNRVWCVVEGSVDAAEFLTLAAEKATANGTRFEAGRWFCDDGELCKANDKTYAFSNQWGGEKWHQAMGVLKEAYPDFKIDFSAAS